MAMTKKHYKAIAKAISESKADLLRPSYSATNLIGLTEQTILDKDLLINNLCNIFKQDNPSFSYEKFIEACYEQGEERTGFDTSKLELLIAKAKGEPNYG